MTKKKTSSKAYYLYVAYLILTACAILFASYTRELAQSILLVNTYLNDYLSLVFSSSSLGVSLRQIVSLALTPILIVALPTLLYRLIKHQMPPYLMQIIWVLWVITALSHLLSQ
ncbi:MAG: hypothetical protein CK424_03895 [Legionella sp.]|nr:MAG: hypothetical protein CK424_03895 [Legionella sp.]